jgi:CubicO group peptidase (beta-lactamase class C family)
MLSPRFRRTLAASALLAGGFLTQAASGEERWNLPSAAGYSKDHGGTALLIFRNGRLELEEYSRGVSRTSALPGFSITKSIVALACLATPGIGLSDSVGTANPNQKITVRHLLSQTSGVVPGYNRLYARGLKDVRKAAAGLKCDSEPGTQFAYGPSHYELLGSVFSDAEMPFGQSPIKVFLEKIGITPAGWRTDLSGNLFLSAGVFLTPSDLLKIGKFIMNRGRIHGIMTLIPPSKFLEAFRGTNANPCYGLGFWLNKTARDHTEERDIEEAIKAGLPSSGWRTTCISKDAPRDLVCMAGTAGQRVYVIPSLRTVIVRTGRPGKFRDPEFFRALFSKRDG